MLIHHTGVEMSKRMECFTAYWNDEASKVTIKMTPEFKADPITIHYALEWIIDELKEMRKKNFKKAEKAGLDIHLGCDSWPECGLSPGGCNHNNAAFKNYRETKEFKFLPEHDLHDVSSNAVESLRGEAAYFGKTVSLQEYRMTAVMAVQDRLIEMNK
jgi:hypothetical protein